MKKMLLFLLITFLLLTGCEKKNEASEIEEPNIVLTKLDNQKDYVYFETLQPITCEACTDYDLQYAYINLNSDSVANINLEIKNFVNSSYQGMIFEENQFIQGRLFHYDSFINENYITLIQDYTYYIHPNFVDINSRIYVVNRKTGKLASNEELLKEKEMTEEDLFSFLLEEDLEDSLFVVSILKKEGYQLYFNQKMELILRYYERDNDSVIKRELLVR